MIEQETTPRDQGVAAAKSGLPIDANPHAEGSDASNAWDAGWWSAQNQTTQKRVVPRPGDCPCEDEAPDPCPVCGATVAGDDPAGGVCRARERRA